MQNPDHFIQGWQAVFGKLLTAHLLPQCWFPAAILALAIMIPSTVLQAQGGGTRIGDVYYLDAQITPRTRLCIGETLWIEAEVKMRPEWVIDANENGLPLSLRQNITAPSINVQVLAPSEPPPVVGRTIFSFRAVRAGTTSVEISATAQNPTYPPVPPTFRYHRSVRIEVVPCAYRVDIGSMWDTSMHGASTVLIANAHDLRMTSSDGENFRFEPPLEGAPELEWTWANNRIRGCSASGGHFNSRAPAISANIHDDRLAITINYALAVPGDANSQYYRNLCLPHFTVGTSRCEERPDGYCWTMPLDHPFDWFQPQTLQPPALNFLLDGGTISTTHHISHSWGSTDGTVHITVTPVEVQQ